MGAEVLYAMSGLLRRVGRLSETAGSGGAPVVGEIPANTRDTLVYGTYEPTTSTAGVISGTVLTPYNSSDVDALTLPSGVTITSKTIYGDIKPSPAGGTTTLRNCLLVGGNNVPGTQSAVVDCNGARTGTGKLILIDCTIAPRRPSLNRDCIVGHKWEAYRCDFSGGIDGMGIFITAQNGTACNVVAHGNYVHDLTYFFPDYANGVSGAALHTDGSHNDCCQIQGGTNIWLKGNSLHGTGHPYSGGTGTNPQKPWLAAQGYNNGQCLIVQTNVTTQPDLTVIIEQNYLYGSCAQLAAHPTAPVFIYRNNKHYRAAAQISPGWAGYWIRIYQRSVSNIQGLTDTQTNVWIDGPYAGTALSEPRDHGIDYIA